MKTAKRLIGMALRSPENLEKILSAGVESADFGTYRDIFDAISKSHSEGNFIGIESIAPLFPKREIEIVNILEEAPISLSVDYFLKEFKIEKALSATLFAMSAISKDVGARKPFSEIGGILDRVKALSVDFNKLVLNKDNSSKTAIEIIPALIDDLENYLLGKIPQRFESGFSLIDGQCSGLTRGSYSVLTARTGVGKTTFACNIVSNIVKNDSKVLFITHEMDEKQILNKIICADSGLSAPQVRNGQISDVEKTRYIESARKYYRTKIVVQARTERMFERVEREIRTQHKKGNCDFAVIDYIQQYTLSGGFKNRHSELTEISSRIQNLAKTLNIAILVLAQLNRDYSKNLLSDPLAHIKDCGAIEQDADVVMALIKTDSNDRVELLIAKNRYGRTGACDLKAELDIGKFTDMSGHMGACVGTKAVDKPSE